MSMDQLSRNDMYLDLRPGWVKEGDVMELNVALY